MLIDSLAFAIEESGALAPVYEKLDAGQDATLAIAASARPFAIAARFAAHPQSMLAVIPGEDAVDGFARSIAAYVGDAHVAVFPMRCDYPFAPKEPERVDDRFDVLYAGVGHCFRGSEAREKLRGHFVYGGVRALCRKNYRDGEREWVFVIEGAFALAVIFVEAAFYLCRSFSFLGQVFAWHGRILRTVV